MLKKFFLNLFLYYELQKEAFYILPRDHMGFNNLVVFIHNDIFKILWKSKTHTLTHYVVETIPERMRVVRPTGQRSCISSTTTVKKLYF